MKRNKKSCWTLLVIVVAFALISCEKNPASPSSPTKSGSFAKTAAITGVEVYRSVQTFEQIEKAMAGPGALGAIKLPAVGSLQKSGDNFRQALEPFYQHAQTFAQASRLQKTNGDSILLDQRWTDPQTGIAYHLWISYNTVSGKATVYTVATNHPSRSPIARDSTRIVIDTNFTLADDKDDVVELLENAKDYRGGYRLRYEEGRIIPDKYQPGSEPKGGVIEAKSFFASGQDTTEVQARLEYHETSGGDIGSWAKTVSFRDGTRYSENITFRSNNVIFDIAYRDGTREQGQFNVPDKNHLSFEKRVTYPPGSDPRSIFEQGDFSRNPSDNSGAANFTREEFFADGSSKRHTVNIKASQQNGFGRLEVTESNSDGTGGSWTLQDGPAKADLKGNWINEQKQYILFNGAFYKDGSGDLHIEVYASKEAYDKGEPPIFKADLHFRPDGSGSGTITSKDGISQFSFSANGAPRS